MPLHLGPRLHAFIGGLGSPSEGAQTDALYREVEALFSTHHLLFDDGRAKLVHVQTDSVLDGLELDRDHQQRPIIQTFIGETILSEQMFQLPDYRPKNDLSVVAHFELREELRRQQALFDDFDRSCELIRLYTSHVFSAVFSAVPALLESSGGDGVTVPASMVHLVPEMGALVEDIAKTVSAKELIEAGLLSSTQAKLDYNLILASGGNPADPSAFTRAPKYPSKSEITDPKDLLYTYLGGTPLPALFDQEVAFTLPTKTRFEHHHIIAGSGHGKTQTLQYLITEDLKAVERGERSVVVIDSQGDLINTISNLAVFAECGSLHDRVVIVDPSDVEWPVSLNLFDVGQDRLEGYAPLDRERLTNSILELYDFVLGSLLDASMTQKQNVIFRYVTRLMLHIPNATIHTLRELMEEGSEEKFSPYFEYLTGSAKHFFTTEFHSKEFAATRRQVLRRLWGILENTTFERMFSHPESKLDLFAEMNAGKVILINTAKDLLKESGTEIFGRFFIALVAQAAQERATLPKNDRMPTMVYIDEAQDYFDRKIGTILSQARKYKIGMVLAHQFLGQLEPRLQEAFAANTSIKMAGGVSNKDARVLSNGMHADASMIERQPKGRFASYLRGITPQAVPLSFPFFVMENMERMAPWEKDDLRTIMRERYAVHYSELDGRTQAPEEPQENEEPPTDPNEPTPYW